MRIYFNGALIESGSNTIDQLVMEKGYGRDGLMVEKNFKIVKKADWHDTNLKEGDRIEFVSFVGGG